MAAGLELINSVRYDYLNCQHLPGDCWRGTAADECACHLQYVKVVSRVVSCHREVQLCLIFVWLVLHTKLLLNLSTSNRQMTNRSGPGYTPEQWSDWPDEWWPVFMCCWWSDRCAYIQSTAVDDCLNVVVVTVWHDSVRKVISSRVKWCMRWTGDVQKTDRKGTQTFTSEWICWGMWIHTGCYFKITCVAKVSREKAGCIRCTNKHFETGHKNDLVLLGLS